MNIERRRDFRQLLRDEDQSDDAVALLLGNATQTLPNYWHSGRDLIRQIPRPVIVDVAVVE